MTVFADTARARRCASVLGMAKRRLDSLLAERGLFESRSQAAASVMAGEVLVGAAQRRAAKPGMGGGRSPTVGAGGVGGGGGWRGARVARGGPRPCVPALPRGGGWS